MEAWVGMIYKTYLYTRSLVMKTRGIRKIFLFSLVAVIAISFNAFSQQAAPTAPEKKAEKKASGDEFTEAERPEDNYLARFTAIKVSEKLMKKNLDNIHILRVIVSNFKDQGWDKDYNEIYENYKKGVGLYYRRDVIYSRVELEKNKSAINDLCKKMVQFYKKEALSMLQECADKILDFSLDEKNKFDPDKNRVLNQNIVRLWIAYGQLDESKRNYSDGFYRASILHLRNAKAYAITILEQLDPEKSKGRFDVQKADNRNRVLNPKKSGRASIPT